MLDNVKVSAVVNETRHTTAGNDSKCSHAEDNKKKCATTVEDVTIPIGHIAVKKYYDNRVPDDLMTVYKVLGVKYIKVTLEDPSNAGQPRIVYAHESSVYEVIKKLKSDITEINVR